MMHRHAMPPTAAKNCQKHLNGNEAMRLHRKSSFPDAHRPMRR